MKKVLFLILIAFTISCHREVKNINSVQVDLDQDELIHYSDFIDSISYLKLQTDSNNILGEINRMEVYKDGFFLQEIKGTIIYHLDKNGFLKKIVDHLGRGPNEYSYIEDFCINAEKQIISVVDNKKKSIINYDFSGKFVSELKNNDLIKQIYCIDNKYIALNPNYNIGSRSGLWVNDSLGNFIKYLKSISDQEKSIESVCRKMSQLSDNTYGFINDYDDYIYSYKDDSLEKGLLFRFNKDGQVKIDGQNQLPPHKTVYFEGTRYLSFVYLLSESGKIILYDKTSKTIKVSGREPVNDIDSIKGQFLGCSKNRLIFIVFPHTLNDSQKKSFDVTMADNPIIQVLYLKL